MIPESIVLPLAFLAGKSAKGKLRRLHLGMAWGAAWRRGHRSQAVRFLERDFLVGWGTSCARPVAAEGPRCGFCRGWRDWGAPSHVVPARLHVVI